MPCVMLVDHENTGVNAYRGIESLDVKDLVYPCHTPNANKIQFDTYRKMNKSNAKITDVPMFTGEQNALDMQLVFYLGWLVNKHGKDYFYGIISQDKGYDVVIQFAKRHKVKVDRFATVRECKLYAIGNGL